MLSEKCTPLWREARFQVKLYKARHARTTFGSRHVEKVHVVVARSKVKNVKKQKGTEHFWDVQKWQAQEIVHLVENEQKSCSSFKNDGRRGAFEEDLERCISREIRAGIS